MKFKIGDRVERIVSVDGVPVFDQTIHNGGRGQGLGVAGNDLKAALIGFAIRIFIYLCVGCRLTYRFVECRRTI